MTISAHAAVPAANRLIDADTLGLTAIRRDTNAGRFPTNPPYVGRAAVPVEPSAGTTPEMLASASGEFRDGYARGYADALGRAVSVTPAMSDEDLLHLAASVNPDGVRQLANAIRSGCPVWCSEDHRGQLTEVEDGFTIGLCHERRLTELTADNSAWTDEQSTAVVLVESCTEADMVTQSPRITLAVGRGSEGRYPDGEDVQGWSGNPGQARTLAAALLAAAEMVEGSAR